MTSWPGFPAAGCGNPLVCAFHKKKRDRLVETYTGSQLGGNGVDGL